VAHVSHAYRHRKSLNRYHRESVILSVCRDFLSIAVILRHGSDYRRIMYEISTVELL